MGADAGGPRREVDFPQALSTDTLCARRDGQWVEEGLEAFSQRSWINRGKLSEMEM